MTISTEKITQVRAAVGSFTDSIVARVTQVQTSVADGIVHEQNQNDPHELTAAQVGLSLLTNKPVSTRGDLLDETTTSMVSTEGGEVFIQDRQVSLTELVASPSLVSPIDDEELVNQLPTLTGSAYRHVYGIDRLHRQFEVDVLAGDYTTPLVSTTSEEDSVEITTPLSPGQYRWRCRDVSTEQHYSDWVESTFEILDTTVYPPTITLTDTPPLTITPSFSFSTFEHPVDTHVATHIRILEDNVEVYSTSLTTGDLETFTVPGNTLVYGQVYTLRVAYEGASYGSSSEASQEFTTATLTYSTPTITTPNTTADLLPLVQEPHWIMLVRAEGVEQIRRTFQVGDKLYHFGFSEAGGAGIRDLLVVRTDLNGVVEATSLYGGSTSDFFIDVAISGTTAYIVGREETTQDIILVQFNLSTWTWSSLKRIITNNSAGYEVKGIFHISGLIFIYGNFNVDGSNEAFVARLSSTYTLSWLKWLDISEVTRFHSGCILGDTLFVIGDTEHNRVGGRDGILLAISATTGNVVYIKKYHGSGSGIEYMESIDTDGWYLYVGGYCTGYGAGNYDAQLTKIDPYDGSVLWSKVIGGSLADYFHGVRVSSGVVYAVGRSNTSLEAWNGLLTAWDLSGELLWQRQIYTASDDSFVYISTFNNKIFVSGYTTIDSSTEGWVVAMDRFGRIAPDTLSGISMATSTLSVATATVSMTTLSLTVNTLSSWTERSVTYTTNTSTATYTTTAF